MYSFTSQDESLLSKLCIAAVKSESEYQELKAQLAGEEFFNNIETEVMCNNMTLQDFARRYRDRRLTASVN